MTPQLIHEKGLGISYEFPTRKPIFLTLIPSYRMQNWQAPEEYLKKIIEG